MNRVSGSSLLAAIGILIAIAALWRPGVFGSAGAGYRLVLNLPEWLAIPLAVAALAMCLAMITPRRKVSDREPPPRSSPTAILVSFLLVAAAITAWHPINPSILLEPLFGLGAGRSLPDMTGNPATERATIDVPAIDAGVTTALLVFAAALTGFALLVIGVSQPWAVLAAWFRARRDAEPCPPQDLASAISAGMRELELGDDLRRAVIACYRRCEAALAAQRRRRYPSETPREFVREALVALALPVNAVGSLLQVFERARFSNLPVTEADRSVALDALGEIYSALDGGGRHESRT